jgi:hypothetical protein
MSFSFHAGTGEAVQLSPLRQHNADFNRESGSSALQRRNQEAVHPLSLVLGDDGGSDGAKKVLVAIHQIIINQGYLLLGADYKSDFVCEFMCDLLQITGVI